MAKRLRIKQTVLVWGLDKRKKESDGPEVGVNWGTALIMVLLRISKKDDPIRDAYEHLKQLLLNSVPESADRLLLYAEAVIRFPEGEPPKRIGLDGTIQSPGTEDTDGEVEGEVEVDEIDEIDNNPQECVLSGEDENEYLGYESDDVLPDERELDEEGGHNIRRTVWE